MGRSIDVRLIIARNERELRGQLLIALLLRSIRHVVLAVYPESDKHEDALVGRGHILRAGGSSRPTFDSRVSQESFRIVYLERNESWEFTIPPKSLPFAETLAIKLLGEPRKIKDEEREIGR